MIGLIGSRKPVTVPYEWLKRVSDPNLKESLKAVALSNPYSLPGCFLADHRELAKFAGNAPINTDNYPVVIFQAPRFTYNTDEPAHVRLLELIDGFDPKPADIFGLEHTQTGRQICQRLANYWRARNRFLHAGVGIKQTRDVQQMLTQVREPLLSIVRESPDFDAAYNPLVTMARHLHKKNPAAAERLLLELESANPTRNDARRIREYLRKQ
jgi:spermidine synthase